MSARMRELLGSWEGLGVFTYVDGPTGAWVFIAVHDDTLGMPLGGTRIYAYPTPEDGLKDALRLAEAMTRKWAVVDVPFGGGKAVIALARPLSDEERPGLLERYARTLNALDGLFGTGEDLGSTTADMAFLRERSEWVFGVDPDTGEVTDPGPFTALGVLAGLRAALGHVFGDEGLCGRFVLVQGVGDVGAPLARMAAQAGAQVLVCDTDTERAERLAVELDGRVVSPDEVYDTPCDVYAPCAVAATLNEESIPRLKCRIVAGSANAQLAVPADADRLRERGILYAPDYVVNAGGATAFGALAEGVADEEEIRLRVLRLQEVLTEIFQEAAEREESPVHAAERRATAILQRGPRATEAQRGGTPGTPSGSS
ncbi:MAG: Glu/Leu/Phe/Val dehydrogenase dimerization domain-containing protein [Gemmatimonadota bacterium]